MAFQNFRSQLSQPHFLFQSKEAVVFKILQINPRIFSPGFVFGKQLIVAVFRGTQYNFLLRDQLTAKPFLREPAFFRHGEKSNFNGPVTEHTLQCVHIFLKNPKLIIRKLLSEIR